MKKALFVLLAGVAMVIAGDRPGKKSPAPPRNPVGRYRLFNHISRWSDDLLKIDSVTGDTWYMEKRIRLAGSTNTVSGWLRLHEYSPAPGPVPDEFGSIPVPDIFDQVATNGPWHDFKGTNLDLEPIGVTKTNR